MLSMSNSATSQTSLPKLAADGSNWIVWKTRIQILIGAKKLAHVLTNSATPPTQPNPLGDAATADQIATFSANSEKYQEYLQSDAEVKHLIVSTIPDSLLIKTINSPTASSLWKAICAEHETKTKRFAVEMLRNLQNQRCQETDDVRQHFTKMLKLREELAATGKVIDEIDFTSILTNSLPPSYDNVISAAYSAATAIDKDITTDKIIAVTQEEYSRRLISSGSTNPTSTALFTNPQKQSSKQNNRKKNRCTNEKCKHHHSHEFKDCRSEGGPLHGQCHRDGSFQLLCLIYFCLTFIISYYFPLSLATGSIWHSFTTQVFTHTARIRQNNHSGIHIETYSLNTPRSAWSDCYTYTRRSTQK